MASAESERDPDPGVSENWFATTHGSVVVAAGQPDSPGCTQALESLCHTYWYPLYVYIRRRGYDAHEAQDLTQEFFARLLARNYLGQVDRAKGKFRSFLIASLSHFLANEWDRVKTEKRGGKSTFVSLDEKSVEDRYLLEPASDLSPEKIFEQRWALTLLNRAFGRLRDEFVADGKSEQFEQLKDFLERETGFGDYASVSAQLGLTPNAVAVLVYRLRQRYRKLVREEIAQTVASFTDIDDEMRHLFQVMRG